ncbi:hypothetical protein JX265_010711 [Neoarthrinium moseri]|uniref:F-box domain-containing protein n=1 Tax=Neoarthrinium moseri TaxID=1658444 RepID=A0A9Q0ALH2_9PEZI|nr:uncharacterized protein JN550_007225 [Neoarthrinium moseri]KAI1851627.1 hypothetical protein JX266_003089 [Neoarthrinium moseri]KAI1858618.1 hypothetical protein JX265_010711 [Neoarthrinium moseri]KAI1867173.1 hypothetical protein JN550_007225 [Neoarthrinium moseri]
MASRICRPFEVIPAELILAIMNNIGVRDLTTFVLLNKRLFGIFKENQAAVMTTILARLVEFESLLLVYTVDKRDFSPDAMLHPRRISVDVGRGPGNHVDLMQCAVGFRDGKLICPRKIVLNSTDLGRIWNMVKVVDWWVEEYPRHRWHKNREDSRCLRRSEELRLRGAVARWWLYSECFHGVYASYAWMPKMWEPDDRLHHLRVMSSMEIRELEDLWETLRVTVQRDICSSISVEDWKPIPWGWDDWRSKHIVSTYMKLDPRQLKDLMENALRLGKAGIIYTARKTQPDFTAEQETLSWSIDVVLQERLLLKSNAVTDIPSSGIIDDDSWCDEQGLFTADAWPTGKPPLSKQELLSYPNLPHRPIPYGDDGHDLDYEG